MEKDLEGVFAAPLPGERLAGGALLAARMPPQKSPASPGGTRVQKVTGEMQRSPPSPKGKLVPRWGRLPAVQDSNIHTE